MKNPYLYGMLAMLFLFNGVALFAQTSNISVTSNVHVNVSGQATLTFDNLPRNITGPIELRLYSTGIRTGYYSQVPVYGTETYICGSYCCDRDWLGHCDGTCYNYCQRTIIVGYNQVFTPQSATIYMDGVPARAATLSSNCGVQSQTILSFSDNTTKNALQVDGRLTVSISGNMVNCAANQIYGVISYDYSANPLITSVTPSVVAYGDEVSISGYNFTGAVDVSFSDIPATFTVQDDLHISAEVPDGCQSGEIVVRNGSGVSPGFAFTVISPSITSFSPLKGQAGTLVQISGSNLGAVTQVFFGEHEADFTHVDANTLEATVPPNGFGQIRLLTPYGTLESTEAFTPQQTVLAADSLALVALYNATNGPNWTVQNNWLQGPVNTWSNITVANNRVTDITIGSNINLQGTLPPDLANLTALTRLIISNNQVDEFPSWVVNLTQLGTLHLVSNGMEGNIPENIGNLRNLFVLDLSANALSGEIPSSIGNLTGLFVLSFHTNQLTGAVPDGITNLTRLNVLHLDRNELDQLPDLSSIQSIVLVTVPHNRLTFEDLEPNRLVPGFQASPQKLVRAPEPAKVVDEGQPLQISYNIGGTQNIYQWYKNNVAIDGATGAFYDQSFTRPEHAGEYSLRIRNTLFPSLTLETEKITVTVIPSPDNDGDGLNALTDCDDNDPLITTPTMWFADADGDGFGSVENTQESCVRPDGFVDNALDCDDANSEVHPDGLEIAGNAIDENCDGKLGQSISLVLEVEHPVYGTEPFGVQATTSSGLEVQLMSSNDAVATIENNIVTVHAAGDFSIIATNEGDGLHDPLVYEMPLNVAQAILRVIADDKTIAYGDPLPGLTITYLGFVRNDGIEHLDEIPSIGVIGLTPDMPKVALCKATKKDKDELAVHTIATYHGFDNNYRFVYECGLLRINRAELVVSADNVSTTYGQPNPEFTISYSGFKNDEGVEVLESLPTLTTSATEGSNAGTYPLEVSGGSAANYNLTYVNGTFTVNKAPLVAKSVDKFITYGEPNPTFEITYTGFQYDETAAVLDRPALIMSLFETMPNAGTYAINVGGGHDNNYEFFYEMGNFTVSKAPLNVIAGDASRPFGQENPVLPFTYSGFVAGQDETVIDIPPYASTEATIESAPGSYPIVVSGGEDNNYELNYVNGTLTVEQPSKEDLKSATSTYVVSPANNATNVNYLLTIVSNDLSHAKRYFFEVNTDPAFSIPGNEKESKKNEIQYLLSPDTRYYVRVKTDISDWGVASTFVTGNVVSLAYVISPADGEGGVSTNVKMVINPIPDATQYTVELSTTPDFGPDTKVQSSTKPTVAFKKLERRTRYYVRATTDLGGGAWGKTTTFVTTDPSARSASSETPLVEMTEDVPVEYHIYPNPYTDELTILVQTLAQEPLETSLADVGGRVVEKKSGMTNRYITLGLEAPKGIYLLTMVTSHGKKTVKVVRR